MRSKALRRGDNAWPRRLVWGAYAATGHGMRDTSELINATETGGGNSLVQCFYLIHGQHRLFRIAVAFAVLPENTITTSAKSPDPRYTNDSFVLPANKNFCRDGRDKWRDADHYRR